MQSQDSIYEEDWNAANLNDEEVSISKSIVARGQFGASYMLGRIRPSRETPFNISGISMMKSSEDNLQNCFWGLRSELRILNDLSHPSVIKLMGYTYEGENSISRICLVFEYCSNGNLLKVLQKGRPYFDGGTYNPKKAINNEILSPGIFLNLCGYHLLKWATEIARGMEYLAFKGVLHNDLSTRNVVLNCEWTAKICNFGISQRKKIQDSHALQLSKEILPLAWMAPEAIKTSDFSEYSDVWSFGITLWEIYTLGDVPYKDKNVVIDTKFWIMLLQDMRPTRPLHANDHIWDLIKSCWSFQKESRPTFCKIKVFLEKTIVATRSKWESNVDQLSGHSCSSGSRSNSDSSSVKSTKGKKHKMVSFAPQIHQGGFLRKCFYVADDILFKNPTTITHTVL